MRSFTCTSIFAFALWISITSSEHTPDIVNNSPWIHEGKYPPLSDLIGDGTCYPPGNNPGSGGPNLPGRNPGSSSSGGIKTNTTTTESAQKGNAGTTTTVSSLSGPTSSKINTSLAGPLGSGSSASVVSTSTFSSFPSSTSTSFSVISASISSASPSVSACSYWLENVKHQGIAAFNTNAANYQVFRNVRDFGAKGDGITDDTAAINAAISSGGRCGPGTCASSTTSPAIVYFPPGTYLVTTPVIAYYSTQIIGNANCMPVIKASASFTARWVIDGDSYQANGNLGWGSTNVFWRQIRNFVIDMTAISPRVLCAGIHWPTAQATSLRNIVFKMSSNLGTQHEGIFVESGSGGVMSDLVFWGGLNGATFGNQQFTMINLTFFNSVTALNQLWDWGWTYKGISVNNCSVALNMGALNNGSLAVGSVVFVDSDIRDTLVGVRMSRDANSQPASGNSLILENVRLSNVPVAVQGPSSSTILAGTTGETTITAWGQGHSYTPDGPTTFQGRIVADSRPSSLITGSDYYKRSKPQYENAPASNFISVRDSGAKGDGVTDDSDVLIDVLASAAENGKIVYFDHGDYLVTKTIYFPPKSKVVGEAFPVFLSSGSFFADIKHPQPVVQIGKPGETGHVEWSDFIVSTKGAQAGAILIQWNLAAPVANPAGMWDVHTRIGGFAGSDLQVSQCPTTPGTTVDSSNLNKNCVAAFMSLHVTKSATGLYMENCWLWVADHDIEDPSLTQITVYAGRGLLIESTKGAIWLVGTAVEHHVLYQYQLSSTRDIFMGQIQTETAYYQPNPDTLLPFTALSAYHDPTTAAGGRGWGLRVVDSTNVFAYGAGLYSFFSNNNVSCSNPDNDEKCQPRIFSVENSLISMYNLNTIGVKEMITESGTDIASSSDNLNGFIDTIALFKS